jgi:hypothetical protein
VRKIRERYERGQGEQPRVLRGAYREAAEIARGRAVVDRPWEQHIVRRQSLVRGAYLETARALAASADAEDRRLARQIEAFVGTCRPRSRGAMNS